MTASVLIATRNRAAMLKRCLFSLENQRATPFEIIVVDNNSTDNTLAICKEFSQKLPIRYRMEQHVGLPFARNRSIHLARGNLYALIDDDCVADQNWLKQIVLHFSQYPNAAGVIGKVENANPTNIASSVEYAYYLRWLKSSTTDINHTGKMSSGLYIDFKNAAFRASFIKQFRFSTDVPYGDVGDEDVEMGYRLYKANQNIYYNSSIRVAHRYSTTMRRLFVRNFWNGYANELLLRRSKINVRMVVTQYTRFQRFNFCIRQAKQLSSVMHQLSFCFLLLVHPLVSRAGRLFAALAEVLRVPVGIPKR